MSNVTGYLNISERSLIVLVALFLIILTILVIVFNSMIRRTAAIRRKKRLMKIIASINSENKNQSDFDSINNSYSDFVKVISASVDPKYFEMIMESASAIDDAKGLKSFKIVSKTQNPTIKLSSAFYDDKDYDSFNKATA